MRLSRILKSNNPYRSGLFSLAAGCTFFAFMGGCAYSADKRFSVLNRKEKEKQYIDFFATPEFQRLRDINEVYLSNYFVLGNEINNHLSEINADFKRVYDIECNETKLLLKMSMEDIAVKITGSRVDYSLLYQECIPYLLLNNLAKCFFPSESEIRMNTARHIFSKKYEISLKNKTHDPRLAPSISLYCDVRDRRIEILCGFKDAIRNYRLTRIPEDCAKLEMELMEGHRREYGIQRLQGMVSLRYPRKLTEDLTLEQFHSLPFDPTFRANDVYDVIDNKAIYAVYREKYEALVAQNKIDPNMTCYDFALLDKVDDNESDKIRHSR